MTIMPSLAESTIEGTLVILTAGHIAAYRIMNYFTPVKTVPEMAGSSELLGFKPLNVKERSWTI